MVRQHLLQSAAIVMDACNPLKRAYNNTANVADPQWI